MKIMLTINLETTVTQIGMDIRLMDHILNRGKVHLNQKQTATLAENLCRFSTSLPVN